MKPGEIQAVLFDLDDTLFDRQRTQSAVIEVIVGEFPDLFCGFERRKIANAFCLSDQHAGELFDSGESQATVRLGRSEKFLELLKLSSEYAQQVADLYLHHYPLVGRPVSGAKQLLETLVHQHPLALVSNGFAEMQRAKLAALDFAHYFDCQVYSANAGFRKPHPKIFQQAARKLGLTPVECLFVGDSHERDVIGARAAGMKTCWYNPDGLRLTPGAHKPDYDIGALRAVARLVR